MRATSAADVAVLDEHGGPQQINYGTNVGVIVSPYAPLVRARIAKYMDEWRTQVPADCLFLDQIGARPWLRDFNPASPSPLAYDDGWLGMMAAYAGRCLMVEDGWDRLARDAVGFHGSLLMMSREVDLPNAFFGAGNWEPYPLATWLLHDKVLLYEHDLYDGTMAVDGEVLAWNMAFGLVSSYSWDALAPGENPWLDLVALLQRDVGPHYAGVPLSGYKDVADGVVESTFGDLDVVANLAVAGDVRGRRLRRRLARIPRTHGGRDARRGSVRRHLRGRHAVAGNALHRRRAHAGDASRCDSRSAATPSSASRRLRTGAPASACGQRRSPPTGRRSASSTAASRAGATRSRTAAR